MDTIGHRELISLCPIFVPLTVLHYPLKGADVYE